MDERVNWLLLADKFALDGDPRGMRACAREIFDLDQKSADGPAVMAEAALYGGSWDEADSLARQALELKPGHLRSRMVLAGLASHNLELGEELSILHKLVEDLHGNLKRIEAVQERIAPEGQDGEVPEIGDTARSEWQQADAEGKILRYLIYRSQGWLADAEYLAGNPEQAAESLLEASSLAESPEDRAELYSKQLFLRNYREMSPQKTKALARGYQDRILTVGVCRQAAIKKTPEKKLRIGYISPDFRQHAVANFVAPFLRDFDSDRFSVYCYATGRTDEVTNRLRRFHVTWRNLQGRSPHAIAGQIVEDHIDILVDLSGHSQNNCLPVLAQRPGCVQVCGVGYTATTGLSAVDYFLSDIVCLPPHEETAAFTERVLRLPGCHLCYVPGLIRPIPETEMQAPCFRNGYVTYGCFNNYAKITDDMLYLWRAILEKLPTARLIIKGKICSISSGVNMVRQRLHRLGLPVERIELRPYSPDYLEQYNDIDVALDTSPYTGGLTTCEALYMGVPVITLRGHSHGSRLAASILTAADLTECIAESQMDYVAKAVQLALKPSLLTGYHSGLRAHMLKSRFMNGKQYMKDVEACYREIWQEFCEK